MTNQRVLILEIIKNGEPHLDADEVYRIAREKMPGLSLSTVYRALRLFKQKRLVKEVHLDEEHHHYEANAPAEHHHLICLGCGRLVEFKYPLANYVTGRISEARGFEITETEIQMKGYCPECRKHREAGSE